MLARDSGASRRLALRALVASALGVGVGYASAFGAGGPPAWGIWVFVIAMPVSLVATIVLGAARDDRPRAARVVVATGLVMLALFVAGFGAALALPADTGVDAPLWLGLPRRAAIILYGVGLLPLFVLPLVYAYVFDRTTLTEEDLARVRAAKGHTEPRA